MKPYYSYRVARRGLKWAVVLTDFYYVPKKTELFWRKKSAISYAEANGYSQTPSFLRHERAVGDPYVLDRVNMSYEQLSEALKNAQRPS